MNDVFRLIARSTRTAKKRILNGRSSLYLGDALEMLKALPDESVDLILTSPPYCIGMPYENTRNIGDFESMHARLLPECHRVLKRGGNLCWQVGYHVAKNGLEPLDFHVHSIVRKLPEMRFRNRIIWTFGHGTHAKKRFSGRHETVMWYSKGSDYIFDLDEVRVPQKYPGKKHYKGPKKGQYSGNPLGKNPGDVWDIPNVKANHIEKTDHPCQFPISLARRLIRPLCPSAGIVLDPFVGSGSTAIAAVLDGRSFLGVDINAAYLELAAERIALAYDGDLKYRPLDLAIHSPTKSDPVQVPAHFKLGERLI